MSNVLEQKINGRRRRSISVFFTVCRLLAGIYPETILDNLINEFPEYFNHLPHRPSRGHGFIRKFQNWEFTRKFIGIIGQGGKEKVTSIFWRKKSPWEEDWIEKIPFIDVFLWRSQYESGCLILAGASWLNTIVNIAYMLFCNKNVQHCATIFGFVLLHWERAINDGWPSGQIDAGWWAVLRNKINVRPIRPFDWLYNCQNHFWSDRMNRPCKCAHGVKPKCDWSLNRS